VTTVIVRDKMPVDIALRKLNKKLLKRGLVSDIRKKLTYTSALVKRKRKKIIAKRRALRRKEKFEV
jgi:ribosomal protein S21